MKKVLIITHHFPPRPTVASLRLQGLAKYLPRFGWEPIILTTILPGQPPNFAKVIQTPYPPDRPEIVYCEKCYLQTVA